MTESDCDHEIVYFAVVNLRDRGQIFGAIDVWRCRRCMTLFCEDKRWGHTELAPEVGFPSIGEGSRWAVLVCRTKVTLNWTLLAAKVGSILEHSCKEGILCRLQTQSGFTTMPLDISPEMGNHELIMVDEHLNNAVEVTV